MNPTTTLPAPGDPGTAELAVEAVGLVKTFGDFNAVDGIDLQVRRGEVFGVLGPNGAGKTTTLSMLATLLPIDGGRASVFGVDVASKPHQIRQLVGVTGQYASVDENLTANENLWLFGRLLGLSSKAARRTASDLASVASARQPSSRRSPWGGPSDHSSPLPVTNRSVTPGLRR